MRLFKKLSLFFLILTFLIGPLSHLSSVDVLGSEAGPTDSQVSLTSNDLPVIQVGKDKKITTDDIAKDVNSSKKLLEKTDTDVSLASIEEEASIS